MILSMSSSRAVSIRIGTSERCRILRHTSIPSRSGSIRSRITSAGASASACSIAPAPVSALRTVNPAFSRYIPTKDAMLGSSSTTRMLWPWGRATSPYPAKAVGRPPPEASTVACAEPVARARPRPRIVTVAIALKSAGRPRVATVEHETAADKAGAVDPATPQPQAPPVCSHRVERDGPAPAANHVAADLFLRLAAVETDVSRGDDLPPLDLTDERTSVSDLREARAVRQMEIRRARGLRDRAMRSPGRRGRDRHRHENHRKTPHSFESKYVYMR